MENRKRQQGTLECSGVLYVYLGYGNANFLLVPLPPPAHIRPHRGTFKQVRTMIGRRPNVFLCVVLKFRLFIVFN